MCGIVGLFAKSPEIEERLGEHLAAMLVQMSSRGPDSAGVAVYRDPAPDGSSKLTLYSADPREDWGAVATALARRVRRRRASRRCARATRSSSSRPTRPTPRRGCASNRPDLRVMSAGSVIEIYKETGLPAGVRRAFALERPPGHARARAHADGDREPRHDRGLASVLDRASTSASSTTARSRTTTGCARASAARASSSRPRTTPRSRPATSRGACARARRSSRRSRAASTTSTASTPSPSARPTASRCCATRSRASRRCSPRPTTGSRWRSEWRAIAVLPGAADARDVGARAGRRLRVGEGARLMAVAEREHAARRGRRSRVDARLRELNQRLHDLAGDAPGPRHWRVAQPERRARASPAGSTRTSRSRSRGTSATTAPG